MYERDGRGHQNDLGSVLSLMEGTRLIATLPAETVNEPKLVALLATAPQLWDAANEVLKPWLIDGAFHPPAMARLANMVAKAVGKTDWKDVAQ